MPSALLVIKRQAQMTRGLHDVEPQRQVGVRATQLPLANCETLKNYPDFYAQVCSCGKLNSVSNPSSRIQGSLPEPQAHIRHQGLEYRRLTVCSLPNSTVKTETSENG